MFYFKIYFIYFMYGAMKLRHVKVVENINEMHRKY